MSSIALRARKCLALLESLVGLLKQPDQEHIGLTELEAIDALDRFRIWAANIGALQDINIKSSLDHRTRDAPKIAKQVTELLDELAESLDDVHSIASHARENRTGALHESKVSPSTENLDPDENAKPTDSDDEELSEIQEIFASIEDAISNLFRFSIIIRNNTNRDRYAKASAAAITNPFNDQFDILHVEHKFPALKKRNDWLIDRLGKAVTQRRQYLKYCRDHHDKTARGPQIPGPGTALVQRPVASHQMPGRLSPIARSNYSKPTSTLAPTQASTLMLTSGQVIETEIEETLSQTSYATSTDEESSNVTITVVKLEEVSRGSKHFECPYCWQIQTARSQKAWKKHVLSDLKPYVCTFENCELKMFSDKHTWFTHELKDHPQEWRCYFCSHQPFRSPDDYQSHLTSSHTASFMIDQFPALLKMSQKALSGISPSDCPLCDDWETRLRRINPHNPDNEILAVTVSQFQHHVGAHMEQLALFAIPRGYTEEGEADSGHAAPQKDSYISSRSNGSANSIIGRQLRLCEEIMVKLMEELGTKYYSNLTTLPPFYLWIPGRGRMMISPLSIPEINGKLETGEYEEAADLFLDMSLFFALFDFTHPCGIHVEIYVLFDTLWKDKIGWTPNYPYGYNLCTTLGQEIQWKFWSVAEVRNNSTLPFPADVASVPSTVRVTMKMQTGELVSRIFYKNAKVEHLYMFAECYELLGRLPHTPWFSQEPTFQHEYHFELNPAADLANSGGYFHDLDASLGSFIPSFAIEVVVLDLIAGQQGLLSIHGQGPSLENTEEARTESHTHESESGDGEAFKDRIEDDGDFQVTAETTAETRQQFDRSSKVETPSLSGGEEDPWELARQQFVSSLNNSDRYLFHTADVENTMSDVAYPCGSDEEFPGLPGTRVLKDLISIVTYYGNVVSEHTSKRRARFPTILGCLKVVLMISAPDEELFETLVSKLESITRLIPRPEPADYEAEIRELDNHHPRKYEVIEAMFLELISFCAEYRQIFYIKQSPESSQRTKITVCLIFLTGALARFQTCLEKFGSRTKLDEVYKEDVILERSDVEATDNSEREVHEWQEEYGEGPESDPHLCMYCGQTEDNDPSESQDRYLTCESCRENAHAECAISAGTLDFLDTTRPDIWNCPKCLKAALMVALVLEPPVDVMHATQVPHDFRPPSQGDDSTWKYDPWNFQSRRYLKEVEGIRTYGYAPPEPDPAGFDWPGLGTLAIVVVQARGLSRYLPHSVEINQFEVTVNVGGVKGRAGCLYNPGSVLVWNKDINLFIANFDGFGRVAVSVVGHGNVFLGKAFINLIGPFIRDKRIGRGWYDLENEGEKVGAIEIDIRFYPNPLLTDTTKDPRVSVAEEHIED